MERERAIDLSDRDASARQAWLREQRLPENGDRLAALLAIFGEAAIPPDSHDPAWDSAVSAFLGQLSVDELTTLAERLRA